MNLRRRIKNFIGHFGGFGECAHCHDTWNWKEHKTIPYAENVQTGDIYSGMFPICSECFSALKPNEILYYCRELLHQWIAETGDMRIIKNYDRYMATLEHNIKIMKEPLKNCSKEKIGDDGGK